MWVLTAAPRSPDRRPGPDRPAARPVGFADRRPRRRLIIIVHGVFLLLLFRLLWQNLTLVQIHVYSHILVGFDFLHEIFLVHIVGLRVGGILSSAGWLLFGARHHGQAFEAPNALGRQFSSCSTTTATVQLAHHHHRRQLPRLPQRLRFVVDKLRFLQVVSQTNVPALHQVPEVRPLLLHAVVVHAQIRLLRQRQTGQPARLLATGAALGGIGPQPHRLLAQHDVPRPPRPRRRQEGSDRVAPVGFVGEGGRLARPGIDQVNDVGNVLDEDQAGDAAQALRHLGGQAEEIVFAERANFHVVGVLVVGHVALVVRANQLFGRFDFDGRHVF